MLQNSLGSALSLPILAETTTQNTTVPCATLTSLTRATAEKPAPQNKREWLITFDPNCKGPNGYSRSGSIRVVAVFAASKGTHTEVTITFQQFGNTRDLVINGSVIGKRVEVSTWSLVADALKMTYTKTGELGIMTLSEKLVVNVGKTPSPVDDVYLFFGSTEIDFTTSTDVKVLITTPLRYLTACQNGYPVAGIADITNPKPGIQIDFSPDQEACDTKITCKIGSAKPVICSIDSLPKS